MIKFLHFADAHIDYAKQGLRDPESGIPLRVLDFLKSLDYIVDSAITQSVDLVVFSGDAYRDRTPAPTYQREWDERINRLSNAGIQTILLLGNHDLTPATGRAHTMQEFKTLKVPNVHIIDAPCVLGPEELGLQVHVIGIPWMYGNNEALPGIISDLLNSLDGNLPHILTAHLSVEGAVYSSERSIMLGTDMSISRSVLEDDRIDYVALGHIHKYQNVWEDGHHPIIYPGSIERVDFGEVNDRKTFVIGEVERGKTIFNVYDLPCRKFIDLSVTIDTEKDVMQQIMEVMSENMDDAMVRLNITYPRDIEAMIDEELIRQKAEKAFEFQLHKKPQTQSRIRLATNEPIASLTPLELLNKYWEVMPPTEDKESLSEMGNEIIQTVRQQ